VIQERPGCLEAAGFVVPHVDLLLPVIFFTPSPALPHGDEDHAQQRGFRCSRPPAAEELAALSTGLGKAGNFQVPTKATLAASPGGWIGRLAADSS